MLPSHSPHNNLSLRKTCNQLSGYSQGTQCLSSNPVTSARRRRAVDRHKHRERKTLPYFWLPEWHEESDCCERKESESAKGWLTQTGVIACGDSRLKLLHKTVSQFQLSSVEFFSKDANSETASKCCSRHHNILSVWKIFDDGKQGNLLSANLENHLTSPEGSRSLKVLSCFLPPLYATFFFPPACFSKLLTSRC